MKASESPESVEYQKMALLHESTNLVDVRGYVSCFLVYGKAKRENEKVQRNSMVAFASPDPSRTHETPSKLLH